MSKRRTKLEKMKAKLRNSQLPITNIQSITKDQIPMTKPEISLSKGSFYIPSFELPMVMLKKDLTKTAFVAILAIIMQIGLAYYLNHGGWQIINSLVISKLMNSG